MHRERLEPRPEVEPPNSLPRGRDFDTATYNYAAGWPDTPTITESAARIRTGRIEEGIGQNPGDFAETRRTASRLHLSVRTHDGSLSRVEIDLGEPQPTAND